MQLLGICVHARSIRDFVRSSNLTGATRTAAPCHPAAWRPCAATCAATCAAPCAAPCAAQDPAYSVSHILRPRLHGAMAPSFKLVYSSPKLAPSARMDVGTAWAAFQRVQARDLPWVGRGTAVRGRKTAWKIARLESCCAR